MKKFMIYAALVCAMHILGQGSARAQFMIGIGYDQTAYTLDDAGYGNPFDGFSAEVSHTMKIIGRAVGINLGVGYQFNTRSDESYSFAGLGANVSSQEQYVSVPLRLVLDLPVSKSGIMLFAGGYAAFGLSGIKTYEFNIKDEGRAVVSYDYLNDVISSDVLIPDGVAIDITAATKSDALSKMEYGLQAGGGLRFGNSVAFSALYNYGLADRFKDSGRGSLTRRGLSFRISFMF